MITFKLIYVGTLRLSVIYVSVMTNVTSASVGFENIKTSKEGHLWRKETNIFL